MQLRYFVALTFLLALLAASSPARACSGPGQEYTVFFNASARPLIIDDLGQAPSTAEGWVDFPENADVIAEVTLTGSNAAVYGIPTAARIERVIKSSDDRIKPGEEFSIKFEFTSCGPNHRSGNQGVIAAVMGADIEDRPVLCLYSRKFSGNRLNVPSESRFLSECSPDKISEAKKVKQDAEKGVVKAQTSLALMYEKGDGVQPDNSKAMEWFKRAAESGDGEAIYQLGLKHRRDKNAEEAMECFERAAKKGHEYAAAALKKQREADSTMRAAKKGEAEAQYKLGWKYDRDSNYPEAMKWYKLAAAQGHIEAANNVGRMYSNRGTRENNAEAAKWYRLAAEKGDKRGQHELAGEYGFLDDYAEAMKWYKLAAAQGEVRSMERIGTLYRYGRGVEKDEAEALRWFQLALEGGYEYVLPSLIDICSAGCTFVDDKAEVARWFRRSAEGGYNVAQFGLGRMYQLGENVEQNDVEAIKWYLLAAQQGNRKAEKALAEMDTQGRGLAPNFDAVRGSLELEARKGLRDAKQALQRLQAENAIQGNAPPPAR